MSSLIAGISKLGFSSSKKPPVDEDDLGDDIDATTVAGGGPASRESEITKSQLRVSRALKQFLVREGVLSEEEAGVDGGEDGNETKNTPALQDLLNKSHINVPASVTDRSHPLPDYFISSSHNTYLIAHQLFGQSSATAYSTALSTGSRCVEIDAWDSDVNKEEPKVTHGYTLVSNIPFRLVCETIRDVVDREAAEGKNAAPILLSLENHCSPHGQLRLAQIMIEVWGDRLLSKSIRDKGTAEEEGTGEHVTLAELGNKIVVIVEYHLPNEDNSSSDTSSDEDELDRIAHEAYRANKKSAAKGVIIPQLAELGVYAQSVKPANNSWFESALESAPHHQLINVSETALRTHMPTSSALIARHNSQHLMRVFPKGTRISSRNLHPVPFWGIGAQICALNWQTYGASAQINSALFAGSEGFVLKPPALRSGGSGVLSTGRKLRLTLHVAGATDVPFPASRDKDEEVRPYVTCTLVHPDDLSGTPPKRKTSPYKPHKLAFLHSENSPARDPVWKAGVVEKGYEELEWTYEENELVFLRILVKSDDKYKSNPTLAVAPLKVDYAVKGEWRFVRALDLAGRETACSVLVRVGVDVLE